MSFDNDPKIIFARSLLAAAFHRGYNKCHISVSSRIDESGTEVGDTFLHVGLESESGETMIPQNCLYISDSTAESGNCDGFNSRFPPVGEALNKRFLESLESTTAAAQAAGLDPVQINPLIAMADLLRTNILEDMRRDARDIDHATDEVPF